MVALVAPVLVMLQLPPQGVPTMPGDGLHVVLLAVVGAIVGVALRLASRRPAMALIMAVLLGVLALWFQRGLWWTAGAVPAPPLLPTLPPPLVLAAGAVVGTALVAIFGRRRAATGRLTANPAGPGIAGAVAAGLLVLFVELDVWGTRIFHETFEGPGGMARMRWLLVVFLGLVLAAILLGWVVTSPQLGPIAPAVAGIVLLVVVLVVGAVGELGGPPRTSLYGLGIGMVLVGVVAAFRRSTQARET